jgi:hypothetical protein
VRTYTTCATCGDRLTVSPAMAPGYMTHPDCAPASDPYSRLQRAYLEAIDADDEDEVYQLARELDAWDERPPLLEAAALTYASWGWPVLPCRPGRKEPATKHGLRDATTDPDRIRKWWRTWPDANVGIATGHAFDAIDIDPAGLGWWRRHGHEEGPLPDVHGKVSTPRLVGWHLYVEPQQGMRNMAGLAAGVDYRGLGGYVLAPPSVLGPDAYDRKRGALPPILARYPVYAWTVYPSPAIKPGVSDA